MNKEELQKLEEEHKKAMEGIKAFNKEAKDTLNLGKKMMGL